MTAAGAQTRRSDDAIHLAVAIRLGVDEVVTCDDELAAAAATAAGLIVFAPAGQQPIETSQQSVEAVADRFQSPEAAHAFAAIDSNVTLQLYINV